MAKVTGPLYSVGASGKIADTMVHFPWKGIAIVREWLKPANPMTSGQGDNRLVLGGTGRAIGKAVGLRSNPTDLRALFDAVVTLPPQQTIQSYLVKKAIALFMNNVAAYESFYSDYNGHSHKSDFDAAGATLNLVTFSLPYQGTSDDFTAGLQVYLIAALGIALGITSAPFSTALASWTSTQTDALVDLITG